MQARQPPSPPSITRLPARAAGKVQLKCSCPGGGGSCPACSEDRLPLQTKLTVSEPGDRFEREADRVADQVMRMKDPSIEELEPEDEIQRQADAAARFGHDFARVRVEPQQRGTRS